MISGTGLLMVVTACGFFRIFYMVFFEGLVTHHFGKNKATT
jgi:phage-related protein